MPNAPSNVAIIDYGVGNLFSLQSSLGFLGIKSVVTGDADAIRKADKLILPGVGAFEEGIERLEKSHLDKLVIDEAKSGKSILGICLGMQLLFEKSYENGIYSGLGLIKGKIIPFKDNIPKTFDIPHIGWNLLDIKKPCKILNGIKNKSYVYFVHSYYAECDNEFIYATSSYHVDVPAVVGYENIYACQFHPEKSGHIGLEILSNFCKI